MHSPYNIDHSLSFIKKGVAGFAIVFSFIPANAQTTVYSQPFSSTLAASGWTVTNLTSPYSSGTYFGLSNNWNVSDAESGRPANTCGAANMSNPSLYMGAVGLGALGAAYLSNARTNRRISSPNINTTGYTNLTLSFEFIGNGEGTDDKAYMQYSTDGGTTWTNATGTPTSTNPALPSGSDLNNLKSQICGSGQGLWTNITWTLPAACENITNLRIAFVWQNDNDVNATDPCFAVDNITITTTTPLPIELISFNGEHSGNNNLLKWITATEINNDYFTLERSPDGIAFTGIAYTDGAGNSLQTNSYSYTDTHPENGANYYRLKQTDFNGSFSYSSIIYLESKNDPEQFSVSNCFFDPGNNEINILFEQNNDSRLSIELLNITGQQLLLLNSQGATLQKIPVPDLPPGIYIIRIHGNNSVYCKKIKI